MQHCDSTQLGDSRTSSVSPVNQDYDTIKQQCLASGTLFEDPVFSPGVAGSKSKGESCEWLRPSQICSNPQFISDGVSRFDAVQGGVGDCWLVSSVSILACNKRLFARVVPSEQSFDQGYCGLFRFRFWQYGKWIEVVIDDRLPTKDGQLLFMRSSDSNEFWTPLLEKAYAKIHGSYQALVGGTTSEALVDFTGGLTEYIDIHGEEKDKDIFTIIKKAYERGSLMGASIEATSDSDKEAELSNGLIKGHAYSITCVTELSIGGRTIQMIRLRNPWSGTSEWKGRWSDQSPEWTMISDYERNKIGLTFAADGEFWMAFQDFRDNFTRVEICHLSPDSLDDSSQRKWYTQMFEGKWIQGISAGGCRNNIDTFATNPQYIITLSDYEGSGDCEIIVSLMQKHRRSKYLMGSDQLTIGFAIYEVPDGGVGKSPIGSSTPRYHQQVLTTDFFQYNKSVARTPNYINLREITNRFSLKPGKYCIIPSTYEPNEGDSEFILRVWTEAPMTGSEMDAKPGLYPSYPSEQNKPAYPPGASLSPDCPNYGASSNSLTPGYPPYPTETSDTNPPPASADNVPVYPPMPEEPKINIATAPQPKPSPYTNYPDIEINPEQVLGIITGLAGLITNCLGVKPTNDNVARRNVGSNFAEAPKSDNGNGSNDASSVNGKATLSNSTLSKVDADQYFRRVAGHDGYIDASELQSVINSAMRKELGYNSFSLDTCKALIASIDKDLIGKLDRAQFYELWNDINKWSKAFKKYDFDNSFTIDANELRTALADTGLVVNRNLLIAIVQRYGTIEKSKVTKNSNGRQVGFHRSLTLDAFVHCCVKLAANIKYYYEVQLSQKLKRDDSFREGNRRAFRPDSPISISSQHLAEPYEDTESVRIGLENFLLRVMYS